MRKIRIGSRASQLARAQVKEIIDRLSGGLIEVKYFDTTGDHDRQTPIDQIEGTDFFTDNIEQALIKKQIDLAIHSAKDLPAELDQKLVIAALTRSIDPDDALVSRGNLKLAELPRGAKIGTSSQRRKAQLLAHRADLQIADLRGNVDQRLSRLDQGEFDAIVVAAAGLIRLGLAGRISERLDFETAAGQGSLALEIRRDDQELEQWLKAKFI